MWKYLEVFFNNSVLEGPDDPYFTTVLFQSVFFCEDNINFYFDHFFVGISKDIVKILKNAW